MLVQGTVVPIHYANLQCLRTLTNIFFYSFTMSFIPPIPEVPRPYRFAIPPGPKLHMRKIWRLKTLSDASPRDCRPLGGWKGSSFQTKGTRSGG